MNLEPNARYATTHEWARPEGDTYNRRHYRPRTGMS